MESKQANEDPSTDVNRSHAMIADDGTKAEESATNMTMLLISPLNDSLVGKKHRQPFKPAPMRNIIDKRRDTDLSYKEEVVFPTLPSPLEEGSPQGSPTYVKKATF